LLRVLALGVLAPEQVVGKRFGLVLIRLEGNGGEVGV
jgi:hypothetical protein